MSNDSRADESASSVGRQAVSPRLAQTLIEHDLVDALHLQVYPVIVGAGKRLFAETSATKRLRLAEAKTVAHK